MGLLPHHVENLHLRRVWRRITMLNQTINALSAACSMAVVNIESMTVHLWVICLLSGAWVYNHTARAASETKSPFPCVVLFLQ